MTSMHTRRVEPRHCSMPRSADLRSEGAESARYVCEICISFSLIIVFLLNCWFPVTNTFRVAKISHSALQGCACKDLHFVNLRGNRQQFAGSLSQRLRDLAGQVGIAARFVLKGIENAELSRPEFDRIPFQRPFFILGEWLS